MPYEIIHLKHTPYIIKFINEQFRYQNIPSSKMFLQSGEVLEDKEKNVST